MTEVLSEKPFKRCNPPFFIFILISVIYLILAAWSEADANPMEVKIPQALYPELHHFLDLVDPAKKVSFDPKMVDRIMNFIEGPKNDAAQYDADEVLGIPSAYYQFDIRKALREIAEYSFNPDIPSIATMPTSARMFHWLDERGHRRSTPRVGRYLEDLDAPMVVKGLQYVENTPDTNSGAYYAYNLHQTLIVFKYRQRNVLITISRQTDVSTVGKKGYVLGTDDDWDYFYTGNKGLTLPALGWVRSYMYDSRAVIVYDEIEKDRPIVRCAMFKWLRAGWSGINMVRRKHILNGLKRFAKPFKAIMEYPLLPPAKTLASDFKRIRRFSDSTLRSKMEIYSNILKKRYNSRKQHAKKLPSNLFDNQNHWSGMSNAEMQSTLVVEYMKSVMGKTNADETRELFKMETVKR
jgi:hypothetical protein